MKTLTFKLIKYYLNVKNVLWTLKNALSFQKRIVRFRIKITILLSEFKYFAYLYLPRRRTFNVNFIIQCCLS